MQSSSLSPSRGFHSSLTTEIIIPDQPLSESCSLHILHQFPPDIIVDPYELENCEDIFTFELAGHLNLELPVFAPDISNTTLLVNLKRRTRSPGEAFNVTIPLHLRYGRPTICEDSQCGSELDSISIQPATVFHACPDHGSGRALTEVQPVLALFPESFAPITSFTLIPPREDVVRSPPTIQIPVAQSQMTSIVELGTTLVILLAAFYLVTSPANGKVIAVVSEATPEDVDRAVVAAQRAFDTVWGLKCPGAERGRLIAKLAALLEAHQDELAAIESLDNGKTFAYSRSIDIANAIGTLKYFAGFADKIQGKVIETSEDKLVYTRHEPIGVCGQIIPWNVPVMMMAWKLGPALAAGNTVVIKPSEIAPLSTLRMCSLIKEAGFPDGVVNVLVGYGPTVGAAISEHMGIPKVAFTGSAIVGRKIMEAAAKTNLKKVTLELGGKSPNIIFNDADLDKAVNWTAQGLYWNNGQVCCAGSRIYVQAGIYDAFLARFIAISQALRLGNPLDAETYLGPLVSQVQFDRVMGYIESGKAAGATVHLGGARHGAEGYWVQPTIFTDVTPDMRIVREEIFGPVAVVIRFEDEEDVLRQANDTLYGLVAAVFTQDINKAITVAHKLQAGTVWVNCVNIVVPSVPFGGYKQSGIGRELGECGLEAYTQVKVVHVNLGHQI
ncbi:hypothetical protein EWM64_g8377 [Hericium alpestre]|uniref:Aldehyde dehydrogenase domain-containing protein n=1 Tax=Hericium alpestre TaxID=135208 RepID=A0A4Y9ZLZ0_9AGAM|nr:hypothetical protein EWM64_g8377 [Hericium alpestre]